MREFYFEFWTVMFIFIGIVILLAARMTSRPGAPRKSDRPSSQYPSHTKDAPRGKKRKKKRSNPGSTCY